MEGDEQAFTGMEAKLSIHHESWANRGKNGSFRAIVLCELGRTESTDFK